MSYTGSYPVDSCSPSLYSSGYPSSLKELYEKRRSFICEKLHGAPSDCWIIFRRDTCERALSDAPQWYATQRDAQKAASIIGEILIVQPFKAPAYGCPGE